MKMKLVECYDPKKNVRTYTTTIIKPKGSADVAVFNNAINAVEGSTMFKFDDTDTVERFDRYSKK